MFSYDSTVPSMRRSAIAGLAMAGLLIGAGPLHAQDAAEPAQEEQSGQNAAPAGDAGDLGSWIKVCQPDQQNEGEEVCLVTQEVRTENGEFLASVSIRERVGEEGRMLMLAVPPGTLLQPGFRAQVDENEQQPGEYVICLPNACYGEMEIEDAFINEMKAGNNLVISVINNQGKAVGIGLTLVGFTKGYEGDPVDTELLAQRRQELQEQLQKRAADARQKLLEQQGGENAGEGGEAAPAEAAPTE